MVMVALLWETYEKMNSYHHIRDVFYHNNKFKEGKSLQIILCQWVRIKNLQNHGQFVHTFGALLEFFLIVLLKNQTLKRLCVQHRIIFLFWWKPVKIFKREKNFFIIITEDYLNMILNSSQNFDIWIAI